MTDRAGGCDKGEPRSRRGEVPCAKIVATKGGGMIARIWRGAVRNDDGDAYARYMRDTGVAGYAATLGNLGVWMLRRDVGANTEFVMFTLWESLEAVKRFAGEDYETAVFYPEDDRFPVKRDVRSKHYRSPHRPRAPAEPALAECRAQVEWQSSRRRPAADAVPSADP
jgi:heme-degrading monooxygenase HmoA